MAKNPRRTKIKLLLDEDVMGRNHLPILNKRPNLYIRHLVHDHKKSGLKDPAVADLAQREQSVVVTFDNRFVKRQKIKNKMAVLRIVGGSTLSAQDLTKRISRVLEIYQSPDDFFGRLISASEKRITENNFKDPQKIKYYLS